MSERCERTSERRSEWPSTLRVDFIIISTHSAMDPFHPSGAFSFFPPASEPYWKMAEPHVTPIIDIADDIRCLINDFLDDFSPLQIVLLTVVLLTIFR